MDLNSKLDFSGMGLSPEGVNVSDLTVSYFVEIGLDARVPLVVPFGSLEPVVKMALSAGMSVVIDVANNPDLCFFKNAIKGVKSL